MRKRVLILGGKGMLGHKLAQTLGDECETFASIREQVVDNWLHKVLPHVEIIPAISAENFEDISQLTKTIKPDVVVNCIGIVKQLVEADDYVKSITINALLPHHLSRICLENKSRLITISTDCVFSGKKGNYNENDEPDPIDLYGRTKLLGEVQHEGCLTIRTSMIGHQLSGQHGLVEWFLNQPDASVKGYKNAIFSGLTTNALAHVIKLVIFHHPNLEGLKQIASEPISKFDLLSTVKKIYDLKVNIEPDISFIVNRSLNGQNFAHETQIDIPNWTAMISQMYSDHSTSLIQHPSQHAC